MSKPIKITEDLIQTLTEEFISSIKKTKLSDGKINYTRALKWDNAENDKAFITFAPAAFAKMVMLIQQFDSEVAWHGVAHRDADHGNMFHVTDILVYPQVVSGSTVNTDQDKYQEWLYAWSDEVFANMRMQGHSHVNMGTTPSSVDLAHQEEILSQLDDDMFYIFMIWNKKFEHTIKIYDMSINTLYENSDITVYIGNEGIDLDAFIREAKTLVQPKYQYGANSYAGNAANGGSKAKTKPKTEIKGRTSSIGNGWSGASGYYGGGEYYGFDY